MEEYEREAEVLKGLANPKRLMIVRCLQRGPMTFTELLRACGFKSSGELNFHLGKLRGLVRKTGGRYELTDLGKKLVELLDGLKAHDAGFLTIVRVPPARLDYALAFSSIAIYLFGLATGFSYVEVHGGERTLEFLTLVVSIGTPLAIMLAFYIFRYTLVEKYPFVVNLPAFTYLLGHPSIPPRLRGEFINRVFRLNLVLSLLISINFCATMQRLADAAHAGLLSVLTLAVNLLCVPVALAYYWYLYRKIKGVLEAGF